MVVIDRFCSFITRMKYVLRIVLLLNIYTVGILLFTRGFLLTRVALSAKSTCGVHADNCTNHSCCGKPRFRRAVLIVIDALRFDFVVDVNRSDICNGDFCNSERSLQVLSEIARDRPFNSRLYRFIADPPTTTLQRLKGLTTGSLPTFVDAGANFASSEISEDNFIDQYFHFVKNITFMGDDTWQVLVYIFDVMSVICSLYSFIVLKCSMSRNTAPSAPAPNTGPGYW